MYLVPNVCTLCKLFFGLRGVFFYKVLNDFLFSYLTLGTDSNLGATLRRASWRLPATPPRSMRILSATSHRLRPLPTLGTIILSPPILFPGFCAFITIFHLKEYFQKSVN